MNTLVIAVRLTCSPVSKVNLFSTDPLKYVCVVLTVENIPTPVVSHESAKKLLLIYIFDSYKIGLSQFTVGLGCTKCFTVLITEITAPIIICPVLLTVSICNTM